MKVCHSQFVGRVLRGSCNSLYYSSYRYFAQTKKTRKSMSADDIRRAQIAHDESGLLKLAMNAEEEFYENEGMIDLDLIQEKEKQIENDLDIKHRVSDDIDDDVISTYSPISAQYNAILDYDAQSGNLLNK